MINIMDQKPELIQEFKVRQTCYNFSFLFVFELKQKTDLWFSTLSKTDCSTFVKRICYGTCFQGYLILFSFHLAELLSISSMLGLCHPDDIDLIKVSWLKQFSSLSAAKEELRIFISVWLAGCKEVHLKIAREQGIHYLELIIWNILLCQ